MSFAAQMSKIMSNAVPAAFFVPAAFQSKSKKDGNAMARVYENSENKFPVDIIQRRPQQEKATDYVEQKDSTSTDALNQDTTTRQTIFKDNSAFVLHNLLSKSECEAIQQQALRFGLQDTGYVARIRVCERVSAFGHDMAAELFKRARPYLADIVVKKGGVCDEEAGVSSLRLLPGRYVPYGLNPCFRVVRYSPGGFFLAHFDGGFAIDEEDTSIKTFMMYLNDDFTGGPTCFFNEKQKHYTPPVEENITYAYQPVQGSCLVFNHDMTHDGGRLETSNKWLLRSEVMYRRQPTAEELADSGSTGSESENMQDFTGSLPPPAGSTSSAKP